MVKEIEVSLINKNSLIDDIDEAAFIGGRERLLSRTEVIAIIRRQKVWEEKTITYNRI